MAFVKFAFPKGGIRRAIAHWFLSRMTIAIALLVIAPTLRNCC
ncbi:MAG: hypothetical protein SVX43_00025 [Cyanobacteriota bacterium]|nr:hypothetical protein [Cyanobacteriota bacterium]